MESNADQLSNDIRVHRDRRLKATLVVLMVWAIVSLLHWRPETQWFLVGLTVVLAVQTVRMLMAKPVATVIETDADSPTVSILVPAKNESAVLADLVHSLFQLNYSSDRLDSGVLKVGAKADIVLLDPKALNQPISPQVEISDPVLDSEPRMVKRGSDEIVQAVYINGIQVINKGQLNQNLGHERLGSVLSLK